MIYLFGNPLVKICSICDETAIGMMMVILSSTDKIPSKQIGAQVEFPVCEQHWELLHVSLEKRLERYAKAQIFLP